MKKIVGIVLVAMMVVSCSPDGRVNKQSAGTVLGALGGAIIGSHIGKGGGQMAAIALGSLAGAALGNQVGLSLDRADQSAYDRNVQVALETKTTGQTSAWNNPDSGNHGTTTPVKTFQTSEGRYCREFTQTISVGGKTKEAYGTACRQPDGSWQISQ
jgi:surface antigen